MVKFGGKIGTLYQMLKNAFKKHPLQNRTNVQIKGGGQRPFEQCSKKLHFSHRRASLTDLPSWFLPHSLVSKFYGYRECELGSHSMVWLKVRQPIKLRLYLLLENIMDPARIHVDKKGCCCDRQICKLDAETSVR